MAGPEKVVLAPSETIRQLDDFARWISDFNAAGLSVLQQLYQIAPVIDVTSGDHGSPLDTVVGCSQAGRLLQAYHAWPNDTIRAYEQRGWMLFVPRFSTPTDVVQFDADVLLQEVRDSIAAFNLIGLSIPRSIINGTVFNLDVVAGIKNARVVLRDYASLKFVTQVDLSRRGIMLFVPRISNVDRVLSIAERQCDDDLLLRTFC